MFWVRFFDFGIPHSKIPALKVRVCYYGSAGHPRHLRHLSISIKEHHITMQKRGKLCKATRTLIFSLSLHQALSWLDKRHEGAAA